jgi:hypothetical protein
VMATFVGAIDQGTTSTRFILYDHAAKPVVSHQLEFTQIYPQAGFSLCLSVFLFLCLSLSLSLSFFFHPCLLFVCLSNRNLFFLLLHKHFVQQCECIPFLFIGM